jgi:glucosylceramidase
VNARGALKSVLSLSIIASIAFIYSCKEEDSPNPGPPVTPVGIGKASNWVTTGDKSRLLTKGTDIVITELKVVSTPTITIDTAIKLQEIEGFGAALTGSSAYVIHEMSPTQRTALLEDLFDPQVGIGINYLRMTIGASDFSLSNYSYDDMPAGQTDEDLSEFSLSRDEEDVVPVLKQIVGIAPDLKIMGSPWSPPAWMKTTDNMVRGKLKSEYFDEYAQYFVKYIEAYEAEGITIDAITPQNEPLYSTANYPCTDMPATDQLTFIRDHLGPVFAAEDIDTKIVTYDHNWDVTTYATSILNDANAKQYVAGSAFHAYGGNVSAMTTVHNAHPDKGLYFTEISGGAWATNFSDNLMWFMQNIFIGTTKNWSKNALLWNLALNPSFGPTNNGCSNCRGVVTISGSTVTKNEEYYSIGHFSKFIRYGAHRVQSNEFDGSTGLISVAFMNEDNSKVVVVANTTDQGKTFTVKQGHRQFTQFIGAKSVVTVKWI